MGGLHAASSITFVKEGPNQWSGTIYIDDVTLTGV